VPIVNSITLTIQHEINGMKRHYENAEMEMIIMRASENCSKLVTIIGTDVDIIKNL